MSHLSRAGSPLRFSHSSDKGRTRLGRRSVGETTVKTFFCIAAAGLTLLQAGCRTTETSVDSGVKVSEGAEGIAVEIHAPFEQMFKDHVKGRWYQPASLVVSGEAYPIKIALRGQTSLEDCRFPKLKLRFLANAPDSLLNGAERIKVGTHCDSEGGLRRSDDEAASLESFLYNLWEHLGNVGHRSQVVTVDYKNMPSAASVPGPPSPSPQTIAKRRAFFFEHEKSLRTRIGASEVIEDSLTPDLSIDPATLARIHLFNILIGNSDWSVGKLSPLFDTLAFGDPGKLKNVRLFKVGGQVVPVPGDFDLSDAILMDPDVDKFAANFLHEDFHPSLPPKHRMLILRLQRFRGHHGSFGTKARESLIKDKAKIEAFIRDFPIQESSRKHLLAKLELSLGHLESSYFVPALMRSGEPAYKSFNSPTPICTSIPPGFPIRVVEKKGQRTRIEILEGVEDVPSCSDSTNAAHTDVWVDSGAVLEKAPDEVATDSTPAKTFTMLDGEVVSLDRSLQAQLSSQGVVSDSSVHSSDKDAIAAVKDRLPAFFERVISTSARGPNCFNTALKFHDPSMPAKTTLSEEMVESLAKDYRILKAGTEIEYGDIVTVWVQFLPQTAIESILQTPGSVGNLIRHAAVYLGGGYVFEKPGIEGDSPYQVIPFRKSMDFYWENTSFPSGFIGTEQAAKHYGNKALPPTLVVFRKK